VKRRTDDEVRDSYADLLGDEEDVATIRLIGDLDAGLTSSEPPAVLWSRIPSGPDRTPSPGIPHLRISIRRHWNRSFSVSVALVLLIALVGVAYALSTITNLGKPVNIQSTAAYFPLSGFHRVGTSLPLRGKPELLFIGAQGPLFDRINVERWPVVKALEQFGSLTGIKAVDRTCVMLHSGNMNGQFCSLPTFDFSHARYRSRYLNFTSKDLIRSTGIVPGSTKDHLFQPLTPAENAIFTRYARFKGQPYCSKGSAGPASPYRCSKPIDYILATIFPYSSSPPARTLPLIAMGHYLQTASQDVGPSDLTNLIPNTPPPGRIVYSGVTEGLPFDTVRAALAQGKDPLNSTLVEDVNAEANIITALICHADGKRPASVCNRPVIKTILKHVK
jgi:hypothetical protein